MKKITIIIPSDQDNNIIEAGFKKFVYEAFTQYDKVKITVEDVNE